MSISLTEWLSLCSLLRDNIVKVSFGEKEKNIYFSYTGSRRIDIAAMKKSNRFISSAALTAKDVANKQSRAESNTGGQNGLQEDLRSSDTATTKPMQKVAYCPIRECSVGLASSRVTDHDNKEYCLTRWAFYGEVWRLKKCCMSTFSEDAAVNPKLWNQQNPQQCMKCFCANSNISQWRNPELFVSRADGTSSDKTGDTRDGVASNENLCGEVMDTYRRLCKEGDDETIKNNQLVVEHMIILRRRGISSVDCGKVNKIRICPSVGAMKGRCQIIEVIKARADNADCCESCQKLKKQVDTRERRCDENNKRHIDPTSKVNVTKLWPEELKERTKRTNHQRKIVSRCAKDMLKKALEFEINPGNPTGAKTDDGDEFQMWHLKFMEEVKQATSYASAITRREEFKKSIESTLVDVLEEGVMSERNANTINFQKEDVADLVKLVVEQMDNTV
eukprot:scaffold21162_cov65-Attheya_sp.AAC.11